MWQFAATFFYLGKLPFAPGTWGSLGALIVWSFLPLSYFLQLMTIIILFSANNALFITITRGKKHYNQNYQITSTC